MDTSDAIGGARQREQQFRTSTFCCLCSNFGFNYKLFLVIGPTINEWRQRKSGNLIGWRTGRFPITAEQGEFEKRAALAVVRKKGIHYEYECWQQ